MIQPFVDKVIDTKEQTILSFQEKVPESYAGLVDTLIDILSADGEYGSPDPKRITCIDRGDYQGTMLFIIGDNCYTPNTYWSIFVNYGSCSGCDSFEAIRPWSSDPITIEIATKFWTLMLHMVQSMKEV
jgi:hypothetical protein